MTTKDDYAILSEAVHGGLGPNRHAAFLDRIEGRF
jgi:hypothetical protein